MLEVTTNYVYHPLIAKGGSSKMANNNLKQYVHKSFFRDVISSIIEMP